VVGETTRRVSQALSERARGQRWAGESLPSARRRPALGWPARARLLPREARRGARQLCECWCRADSAFHGGVPNPNWGLDGAKNQISGLGANKRRLEGEVQRRHSHRNGRGACVSESGLERGQTLRNRLPESA